MKQLTNYLLGILVVVTTLQSCKKDDGGTVAYPSGQGEISATGDLSANLKGATAVFQRTVSGSNVVINIAGVISVSPQKGFGFQIQNITAPGTYSLAATTASQYAAGVYYAGTASTDTYSSFYSTTTPGTVTITAISATSIEGTYTNKVSNTAGASLTYSGSFRGSF